MGFYSGVFLVFLMKESKKGRRKQPGKLMAKSRSQPVNLPGARPLMNPLHDETGLVRSRFYFCRCVTAINAKVIYRFAVNISDYILSIAWV